MPTPSAPGMGVWADDASQVGRAVLDPRPQEHGSLVDLWSGRAGVRAEGTGGGPRGGGGGGGGDVPQAHPRVVITRQRQTPIKLHKKYVIATFIYVCTRTKMQEGDNIRNLIA